MTSAKRVIRDRYRLYNMGPKTDPCGTPAATELTVDIKSQTRAENVLFNRKEARKKAQP